MLERLARDSLLGTTSSFIVWSIYFVANYAFLSIGCVAGLDRTDVFGVDMVRLVLGVLTITTCGLIAYFGGRSLQLSVAESDRRGTALSRRRFMVSLTARVAGLALVSTLWVGLPILFLPACG